MRSTRASMITTRPVSLAASSVVAICALSRMPTRLITERAMNAPRPTHTPNRLTNRATTMVVATGVIWLLLGALLLGVPVLRLGTLPLVLSDGAAKRIGVVAHHLDIVANGQDNIPPIAGC